MPLQRFLKTERSAREALWLIAGTLAVASVLRAPITAIGPLVSSVQKALGIGGTAAGLITVVPLLAFAFLSPFAPQLARRFGMGPLLFASLAALAAGVALRPLGGYGVLLAGTLLIGFGISIGNVLLPGFVKLNFPYRIGLMTGLYALTMNTVGALSTGLSVPLAEALPYGWRGSLLFWLLPVTLAMAIWLPQVRRRESATYVDLKEQRDPTRSVWRSPLAWAIALMMGSQSLIFYTIIAWMPQILTAHGFSSASAGWTISIMQIANLPVTFFIPMLADKMRDQRLVCGIVAALLLAGALGMLFGTGLALPLSVIVIGVAGGASFSLAMVFFSLRTSTVAEAADLSGMAQSFGYLFAALGPFLFGFLHDWTGDWTLPLWLMLLIATITAVTAMIAGRDRKLFQ